MTTSRADKSVLWFVALALAVPVRVEARAQAAPAGQAAPAARVSLDRVVAVVNGDLLLESDVEEEQRFAAFQPFSEPSELPEDRVVNRLIDRQLIVQQMALQPEAPIPDDQVTAQLAALRKDLPACTAYHCETEAGWQKFVEAQGFTVEELKERWRLRMEVLRFIEERFRMGIRIDPAKIDAYYKTTLVPAYEKQKAKAPAETAIADRIQEVLLQQQVTALLDDWLKTLRAQGSVRLVKEGEAMP